MVSKVPLIVFDMDGVLVKPRSSWRVIHDHFGVDNEESYELYMRGMIDDMEFMRRDISIWKGIDPGLSLRDIRTILSRTPRMGSLEASVNLLRDAGASTAIVSGGIDILAEILNSGALFDHVIANGLDFDARSLLSGEGILRVPLRDKGVGLRKILDGGYFEPVVSLGDSHVDASMFSLSDLSVAFRPMDDIVSSAADAVVHGDDLLPAAEYISSWIRKWVN
ncbi:MAG: HAD-IB family phosphatase [Thermoplasmatota archaeon]